MYAKGTHKRIRLQELLYKKETSLFSEPTHPYLRDSSNILLNEIKEGVIQTEFVDDKEIIETAGIEVGDQVLIKTVGEMMYSGFYVGTFDAYTISRFDDEGTVSSEDGGLCLLLNPKPEIRKGDFGTEVIVRDIKEIKKQG